MDLDAILAQRREATGSDTDDIAFTFAGQKWTMPHPLLADDDWKEGLSELDGTDVEVARYYLGDEQYERFRDAGGKAGYVFLLIQQVSQQIRDEATSDRPTRRSTSSATNRKRSKPRS